MKSKAFLKTLLVLAALFAQEGWAQINDNFNDNFLDPSVWNVLTPFPGTSFTVSETNQRLEVTLGAGFGGAGIVTLCQFPADFDVQVDYAFLNWPATNLHSVRLGAPDLGVGPGGGIGLNRSSFPNGGTGEFYLMALPSADPQIATTQSSGKLRLVRTGSTLSGLVMVGTTWIPIGSGPVSTAATRISLDLGSGSATAQGGVSIAFDNFQTNSGTVSCACNLNVQELKQGIFPKGDGNPTWESDIYDHSSPSTIYQLGCALTSLSMALNFAGVPTDPGSLNRFMIQHDTDYSGASVNWGPTTKDISTLSGKKISFQSTRLNSRSSLAAATQYLDDTVCQKRLPVIVGVNLDANGDPQHYVLVTGKEGSDFLIADPFFSKSTLGDYNNEFETRGFVPDPPGDISELDLTVGDNAELLVIDRSGKRTGFDSSTVSLIEEIPLSAHFVDALQNDETGAPPTQVSHSIQVRQPMGGTYRVVLSGLTPGTYTMSVRAFSLDGSSQPETVSSGIAGIGSISTLKLQFASSPGSTPTLVVLATFQSTLADIDNSLQLELIDNHGVANSLSQKVRSALDAATRGQKQAKVDILDAFKNEINAQSGKHIRRVAVQVLLQDAASLLSQ